MNGRSVQSKGISQITDAQDRVLPGEEKGERHGMNVYAMETLTFQKLTWNAFMDFEPMALAY